MSPIVCESLENFQPFMEVFIGGIILDDLKEEGSEDPQAVTLKTKPRGQQSSARASHTTTKKLRGAGDVAQQ